MSAVTVATAVLENHVLTFALLGGAVYLIFFTEVGPLLKCALNPVQCAGDAAGDLIETGTEEIKKIVNAGVEGAKLAASTFGNNQTIAQTAMDSLNKGIHHVGNSRPPDLQIPPAAQKAAVIVDKIENTIKGWFS